MKTRIISATVGIVLFAAILLLSTNLVLENGYPVILTAALSILAAVGTYEILHNTGIVKNNIIVAISLVFSLAAVFVFSYLGLSVGLLFYFVFVAVLFAVSLFVHDKTTPSEVALAQSYSLFLAFAFSSVNLIISEFGLFYFFLIFIFAWASDTCAYFAGVFLGRHKLCPELSPKKTVEGAIGGIVGCVALTLLACSIADMKGITLVVFAVVAAVFSVIGMVGDISASYIKRAAGIKDYGNLMPGHGGVLDRFDSVLLISPVFYAVLTALKVLMFVI